MTRWALFLLCAVAACDGCGTTDPTAPAPSAAPKPPVPVPTGLSAEAVAPTPDKLLTDLREAARGPALFLPRTIGSLVANAAGLPLQAVELIDERLPIVAATLSEGGAGAVHIRDRVRIIAVLTNDKDAWFTAREDGDFVWFTSKRENALLTVALVDNYLVAGTDEATVRKLGPYLTRNVASKAMPKSDIGITLHNGDALRANFARATALLKKYPMPPATAALVNVDMLNDAIADLLSGIKSGDVTIDLTGVALDVDATLRGEAPTVAAIPSAQFASLPDDTFAAVAWSQSEASRVASAKSSAAAIGKLLSIDPATPLERVARARGDSTLLAGRCTGIGVTGFARGDAANPDELREGLDDLVALRKTDTAKAKLKEAGLSLDAKKTRITAVPGDMWRLRLIPKREGADARLEAIDLLYTFTEDSFYAAAGMETVDTIQHMYATDKPTTWSSKDQIKAALSRFPEKVWFAALGDAQAFNACMVGRPGGQFAAPIAMFAAKHNSGVHLRIEIARALIKLAVNL